MLENNQKEIILLRDLGYLKPTDKSNYTKRYGIYKCHCGNEFKAQFQHINRKLTTSCGCIKKANITLMNKENATHNLSKHRLYDTWYQMIQRCKNPKSKHYKNYGGRGIKVCDEWLDINTFINDMYPTYIEGLSIDRIDNDKGYSKDNCRWATNEIQTQNIRKIKSNNTSGYKGVGFNNKSNKWFSYIGVNKKRIHFGYFNSKIEAAKARDRFIVENKLKHTRDF